MYAKRRTCGKNVSAAAAESVVQNCDTGPDEYERTYISAVYLDAGIM